MEKKRAGGRAAAAAAAAKTQRRSSEQAPPPSPPPPPEAAPGRVRSPEPPSSPEPASPEPASPEPASPEPPHEEGEEEEESRPAPAVVSPPSSDVQSSDNTAPRAEEEETSFETREDPYVYSDDSDALSDAYFFPQSSDAEEAHLQRYYRGRLSLPQRLSDDDFLTSPAPPPHHAVPRNMQPYPYHYPLANYYGSLSGGPSSAPPPTPPLYGPPPPPADVRATSPLWTDGYSIQEDAELLPPLLYNDVADAQPQQYHHTPVMDRRQQRKLSRRQQKQYLRQVQLHRQRAERVAHRERAVQEVRGRPQLETGFRDWFWAVLFLLHLAAIVVCAAYYGSMLFQHEAAAVATADSSSSPASTKHGWVPKFLRPGGHSKPHGGRLLLRQRRLPELAYHNVTEHNATTNGTSQQEELLYHDDDAVVVSQDVAPFIKNGHKSNMTANVTVAVTPELPTASTKTKRNKKQTTTTVTAEAESFEFTIDYQNVIDLLLIAGFYACVLSYLSFGFMLILARALIQIMLVFSVLLATAWGIIGLTLDPYGAISVMGFTALLLTLGYTMYSWNRIPIAGTNLYTAFSALRCTADITIIGLGCLVVTFVWWIIWGMAFIGIVNSFNYAECDQKDNCEPHVTNRHIPLILLLLFSFHWTNTVIKNVVRVTIASVVGTWWFHPQTIGPFCTSAVVRPLLRSVTTSLGSICLGSLVVQPAQALEAFGQCCCCCCWSDYEGSSCGQGARVVPDRKKDSVPTTATTDSAADEEDSAADSVGLVRRFWELRDRLRHALRSCNQWSYTYIGMCEYLSCVEKRCSCSSVFSHYVRFRSHQTATALPKRVNEPFSCLKRANGWMSSRTISFRTCCSWPVW
jgi:hypothetical protein